MILNKRYRRNIKENLSFYVSSSVLTIVTLLMFYLFYIAGTGINAFGDDFFARNAIEDANFTTYQPISEDDLADLETQYHVTLEAQPYCNVEEDDFTARVFHPSEKIDRYEVTEGQDLSASGDILISEGYAVNQNVAIGSTLTLQDKTYTVVGYFQRPDYLYMLESPDDSYKNISTFFLAYVSDEDFATFGETPVQYLIRYSTDNSTDVRKAINESYTMKSYLSAEENARITMVHEQADIFLIMSYIILFLMPLIAVTLICLILNRKVKREQKMIGTLSALGYQKSRLLWHYAGFAAIPGIVGGVLTWILTSIFEQPYGEMSLEDYEPMRVTFHLPLQIGLLGVLIPTIMYMLAAMFSVSRLLRKDTVAMLNGTAGEKKRKKPRVFKGNMKLRNQYALRSLLGNPARSLVILMGVFLGSYIMLLMFGIVDSVQATGENITETVGDYEYLYLFNTLKTDALEDGSGVLVSSFEDENQNAVPVYGVDTDNPYLHLKDTDGDTVVIDDGYYMTSVSAILMDVQAGDTITLYNPLSLEYDTVTIRGILENDIQKGIFTSRANAEQLLNLDAGTYNGRMSAESLSLDAAEVSETVRLSSISEQTDTMLDQMGMIIALGVLLGGIICIAAIYVAVNTLLTENRHHISMLKVLGYNDSRIHSMVLRANHILLPIGILLSIPAVWGTLSFYFGWFASYIGMIMPIAIRPQSLLLTVAITAICYFGSVALIGRKTKSIDMVESLKDNRE